LPFEKDYFVSLEAASLVMFQKGALLNEFSKVSQKLTALIKKSKLVIVEKNELLHKNNA
jgi:hypothetical protein